MKALVDYLRVATAWIIVLISLLPLMLIITPFIIAFLFVDLIKWSFNTVLREQSRG